MNNETTIKMPRLISKTSNSIMPLLTVLFIDGAALGLMFIILNNIIFNPSSTFLLGHLSDHSRNLLYGITISIFMLSWFFGAAFLSYLSDSWGRKKTLLICLSGTAVSYLLFAFAVLTHSIVFLIISRVLGGFTAGSQPIAQAAICDSTHDQYRLRNISLTMLALSLGFVLGPIIGGILSDSAIVSFFNNTTPLYFAAIIAIISVILLWGFFDETSQTKNKIISGKIFLRTFYQQSATAFVKPRIRGLAFVLLLLVFGWSNYYTFISSFLFFHYAWSIPKIALLLAVLGLGFSVGSTVIVRFICQFLPDRCGAIITTTLIAAVSVLCTFITQHPLYIWISAFFIGATVSVAYSMIIDRLVNLAKAHQKGWLMGVTGSIVAFCFSISILNSCFITGWHIDAPLKLAFGGLCLSAMLLILLRDNHKKTSKLPHHSE